MPWTEISCGPAQPLPVCIASPFCTESYGKILRGGATFSGPSLEALWGFIVAQDLTRCPCLEP